MAFQDHFSTQADAYARFRPHYPPTLFEWLASVSPGRALVWDCGTGSGQAAVALTAHFEQVVASDPSPEQIAHATRHARVHYVVGPAEEPPDMPAADLVSCAQALHWFDHARFYPALARVLRPGGVFAAWGYGHMQIAPAVDEVVFDYYANIVGPHWPPDRRHIESHYQTVPFPLTEIAAPAFAMTADWSLDTVFGYLDTWSATRRYRATHGAQPLDRIRARLAQAWGRAVTCTVTWPLFVRVGRFS